MNWQPIEPYTDPALEHLAAFIAERLNCSGEVVRRWVVSELPSYLPEEYPLLQLQCLSSSGEALQNCKGSIRYCLLNQQMQVGEQQQLGFRWIQRAIAKLLRQYEAHHAFAKGPLALRNLQQLESETRTGPIKGADGTTVGAMTWVEIFFEYGDRADIA